MLQSTIKVTRNQSEGESNQNYENSQQLTQFYFNTVYTSFLITSISLIHITYSSHITGAAVLRQCALLSIFIITKSASGWPKLVFSVLQSTCLFYKCYFESNERMRSEITLENYGFGVVLNHLSIHIHTLEIRENGCNDLTRAVIKHSAL